MANLKVKVINGLLPETVTLDFSVKRSITIGMMCLIETLAIEVAVSMYIAEKYGASVSLNSDWLEIHRVESWAAPTNKKK